MYQESDLVCIGKRENNKKRNYLVVNKLQGKHIPVSPSKALGMFDALADILKEKYSGKKLLLVGFALRLRQLLVQRLQSSWVHIIFRQQER